MYKDFKKSESLDTGFIGGSGFLWMFSGIILGLLFGLGMYYFSNDRTPRISIVDSLQKKIKSAQSTKTSSYQKASLTKTNYNVPQKTNTNDFEQKKPRLNKFSYYAVLPTLDVPVNSAKPIDTRLIVTKEKVAPLEAVIIDADKTKIKKQVKPEILGDYLLQVASFKKQSMANKTRGRLSNNGIDAYVQKKKVKGRFWYRVVAGPVDQQSVDNWKLTAEKLGHRPLVISVR